METNLTDRKPTHFIRLLGSVCLRQQICELVEVMRTENIGIRRPLALARICTGKQVEGGR